MTARATLAAVLIACCLSLTAGAQVGDKALKFDAKEIFNSKYKKTADFKGKLLLVEFFAHW